MTPLTENLLKALAAPTKGTLKDHKEMLSKLRTFGLKTKFPTENQPNAFQSWVTPLQGGIEKQEEVAKALGMKRSPYPTYDEDDVGVKVANFVLGLHELHFTSRLTYFRTAKTYYGIGID